MVLNASKSRVRLSGFVEVAIRIVSGYISFSISNCDRHEIGHCLASAYLSTAGYQRRWHSRHLIGKNVDFQEVYHHVKSATWKSHQNKDVKLWLRSVFDAVFT